MKRKQFLKYLSLLPLTGLAMELKDLEQLGQANSDGKKMPVLFLGHGSPMNAIEENEFVAGFRLIAQQIPKPSAILCVSAHWETQGTQVTAMPNPLTIHDFGGFPKELFQVQYPAKGSPNLAVETKKLVNKTNIQLDHQWGLDHGAWSVLKHLYPQADVPVVQLSLDQTKGPQYHYELAQQLMPLRQKGVLIVGSGNMVHNLRMVAWQKLNETFGYDWALEANEKMKTFIQTNNHRELIQFRNQGKAFDLAIPTPEHYLPLLYSLALQQENEAVTFFNDQPVAGSLTMTSLKIG